MSRKAKFDHTGSSFDDFLEAGGIREEVEAAAIKAVIAADLQRAMMQQKLPRPPSHAGSPPAALTWTVCSTRATRPCRWKTISRAATFMGKRLHFNLSDAAPKASRKAEPTPLDGRAVRRKAAV